MHGGPGNDLIEVNAGNDVLHAADGHEWNDRLSGGPGTDKAYLDDDGVGAWGEWITNDPATGQPDIEIKEPVFVLP